jgi:cytochrome P450
VIGSANPDPAVFENPDTCLGAPLARMESEVALLTILSRFPDLALASDRVEWLDNNTVRGLKELRVTV